MLSFVYFCERLKTVRRNNFIIIVMTGLSTHLNIEKNTNVKLQLFPEKKKFDHYGNKKYLDKKLTRTKLRVL